MTTEALRNRVFIKRLGTVADAMLEGEGISGPLARTRLFPGTATQMLRVGEETGSLDDQLQVTAEYYEVELDYKIKKLTSIFEPLVIIVMGAIVGLRRHRPGLGDVRHLQPGGRLMHPPASPALGRVAPTTGRRWSRRWWRW